MFPLWVYALSGKCGDNVTYDFNETTHVLTISGEGSMYNYTISNKSPFTPYNGNLDILEVIINDGVTSIGDYAFWICSTITSVTIPNSVKTIGRLAFQNCSNLTSVVIPEGVSEIGYGAFLLCENLSTISIPSSVKKIGPIAFDDCISLNSVHITDIGSWCKIEFGSGRRPNKMEYTSNPLRYAKHLYLNNVEVTDLVIPNSVDVINTVAFIGFGGLKTVDITNGVTSIGQGSFQECSNITSVNIPSSVIKIEGVAFNSCTSLESIYIPSSVTYIGGSAFAGCASLSSAILSNGISQLGQGVFRLCSNLTFATFPNTITDLSEWVFSGTSENLNLYCYSEDVPVVHENPVGGNSDIFGRKKIDGTLYVPKISINEYSESDKWNMFSSIEALPELNYMIDGEIYKSTTPMVCTPIPLEPAPVREGYTFSGWSEIPDTMPVHDVTVTGSFIINKYKLTYIVDNVEYKTCEIEYSATITPEAEPTREGYTFSGWSGIPATMPAHDVTITGTFTVNKYKLTYKIDGEECKSYDVEFGVTITPEEEPTKEGYTFSGWSYIPETMPAHDLTVTGTFTVNKYKLTYKVDGDEYKSYEVDYGAIITPEAAPTKEYYTFSGWDDIPNTMPAHDVTVTGTFTINKYKLIYKVDGEEYKSYEVDYGSSITPEPEPTKEGYTFSGWSWIPTKMPAEDVTITGTFTVNKYKLTYKVDGEEYKSYEVDYGSSITPEPEPTKEGYTFSGWSWIPTKMPAEDVTISGIFTLDTGIEQIISDENGKAMIFTIDGKRVDNLKKGVNIVHMKDGTTRKVVLK